MHDTFLWSAVAVIAAVTALTRFLPFLLFHGKRKTPALLEKLGRVLPHAIMGMLVVYCLKDTSFSSLSTYLPALISCAVVVLLHLWRRNTLLSIVGGTLSYMLLVQFVFT